MKPLSPLLLVLLVLTPALVGAQDRPWNKAPAEEALIVVDPEGLAAPFVRVGEAVELTANGLSLRIQALSEAQRRAFFELRTDLSRDPLPPRSGFSAGFTVFELSFRNHAGVPMRFQPALAALRWNRDNELLQVHLDTVFDMLRALYHGDPELDRKAVAGTRWFHVEPLDLPHGHGATKLLVFEGYGKRVKRLTLELGPLLVGTESFSPTIDFLLVHPDKRKNQETAP